MTNQESKRKKLHVAVIKQMITLATSGFGLVAALAWNNVIQEFVNNYVKKYISVGSGTISLFLYAIAITILAVFITYQLSKIAEKLEK
ncbi:hypothetical protein HYW54_01775 [Candidatus Gottesmanbacteria bacterium]|nr:hypothetical protein [Candidatus Gottesmanbacteria bacterium]